MMQTGMPAKRGRRVAMLGASAFVILGGVLAAKAISAMEDNPPDWLVEVAQGVVDRSAAKGPTSASFTLTDTRTAGPVVDPEVVVSKDQEAQQEYVVILEGQFTWQSARVPPGGSLPSGSMIVFTVSPPHKRSPI